MTAEEEKSMEGWWRRTYSVCEHESNRRVKGK